MKILRVSLQNLASLAGPVTIDFEGDVLRRNPVFAITGKTGAGKSTILDAICLALYDKTPRYDANRSRAPEVEKGLGGDDVRNILRKGTGSGFAETEFRGRDGQRYRARWIVRRAREKVTGSMQFVQRELYKMDGSGSGTLLAAKKSEVEAMMPELVGFDYAQFCHAVLLAQGEFRKFLEAEEKERAALLEKITGSFLYGRLSVAAHEHGRLCREEISQLQMRLGAVPLASDEERLKLATELKAAGDAKEAAAQNVRVLTQVNDWYAREEQLLQAITSAEAGLAAAQAAMAAAGPDFARLELRDKAQVVHPAWVAEKQNRSEEQQLRRQIDAARATLEKENRARAEAEQRYKERQTARLQAEQQRERLQPELKQAVELDSHLATAADEARKAEQAKEAARLAATNARQELEQLRQSQTVVDKREATAQRQLDRWQQAAAILEHPDPTCRQLQVLHEDVQKSVQWRVSLDRLRARAKELEKATGEQLRVRDQAAAEQGRQRTALTEAIAAIRQLGPDALRTREKALEKELGTLEATVADHAALAETDAAVAEATKTAQDVTSRLTEISAQVKTLEQVAEKTETALAEKQEILSRLNLAAAADVEALRAHLKPGQPCPVCGSAEHPYGTVRSRGHLAKELKALNLAVAAEKAQMQSTKARLQAALKKEKALATNAATVSATLKAMQEQLAARQKALAGRPSGPEAAAVRDQARAALAGVQAQLVELGRIEKRRDLLQTKIGSAEAKAREVAAALAKTEQELRTTSLDVAREETAEAEQMQALEKRRGELKEFLSAVPDWRDTCAQEPAQVAKDIAEAARKYRTAMAEKRTCGEERQMLQQKLARADAAVTGLVATAGELEQTWKRRQQEVDALRGKRQDLIGNRAVAAVERELREALEAAKTGVETAQVQFEEVSRAVTRRTSDIDALGRQSFDRFQKAEAAKQEIDRFCAEAGVPREALAAVFAVSDTAYADIRSRCDALKNDIALAAGARRSCADALDRHRQAPPALSREEAAPQLATAESELKQRDESLTGLRVRQQMDDELRTTHADLARQIEAKQQAAKVWLQLAEVVGSSDGAKFRNFAQALNLRILVAQANEHLKILRPRYRLAQNSANGMDLVLVDRDMNNECRPVRSLSGGESFLASLALALGLSSLASQELSVDSLFIDEGFGSLDPEALGTALDLLQGLQQQGKQVGIISHVEGVAQAVGAEIRVEAGVGGSKVTIHGVAD